MSRRCDKCEHYEPNNPQKGACRHSPPVLTPDDGFIWPIMDADDWCGEFKPRGTEEPEPVAMMGVVCGGGADNTIVVRCDYWQPKHGSRVEMRVVKGPDAETNG